MLKIKRVVRRKRPGLQDELIMLQHDNAGPHRTFKSWTVPPYPPYCSD